tara:strand:+ start:208 stop:861 length:654 start_codon:yes stop_codon:yes gene_type:complete
LSLLFINIVTSIPDIIIKTVEENSSFAYFVIGFAMFLENIIPPIPSEIIMPLGGYFVYQGSLNFYILVLFGTVGTLLGSFPWYFLGKSLNEQKISKFLDNKGKFLGITSNDLSKSRLWFDKYGTLLVFWGRLIPGIRTLISVPAGIELMPIGTFLIWTTLGTAIWVTILTTAGYLFGENYQNITLYIDNFKIFLKPIFIIFLVFISIKFLRNYIKNK